MRNYSVSSDKEGFHYKRDAIAHAIALLNICNWSQPLSIHVILEAPQDVNVSSKIKTFILHPSKTSCVICGNELEGNKQCPLCGALHYHAKRKEVTS